MENGLFPVRRRVERARRGDEWYMTRRKGIVEPCDKSVHCVAPLRCELKGYGLEVRRLGLNPAQIEVEETS